MSRRRRYEPVRLTERGVVVILQNGPADGTEVVVPPHCGEVYAPLPPRISTSREEARGDRVAVYRHSAIMLTRYGHERPLVPVFLYEGTSP